MDLFTGMQYLRIDIANNFGLDKNDWDDRLKWFAENESKLDSLVSQAAEPALFYAAVQAYKKAKAREVVNYPISLDATSSGLQILAAITCDRKAAMLCNVLDAGKRMDAYVELFHIMRNNMLKIDGEQAGRLKREDLKDAIMTSLYGSEAVPKEVFGEGMQLKCFYGTMKEEAPIAWALNEAFLAMWQPDATEYTWTLPDNFHVVTKVMDTETETVHFLNNKYEIHRKVNRAKKKGRALGANTIHSLDGMIVREITRRCNYDPVIVQRAINAIEDEEVGFGMPDTTDTQMVKTLWRHYEKTGYLSARILDHLHANNAGIVNRDVIWELIDSLPEKPFEVIAVHDCFRVLPNYGNDLRKQYNLQLALLARSEILSNLIEQIIGRPFKAPKGDPSMWSEILHNNYSLS